MADFNRYQTALDIVKAAMGRCDLTKPTAALTSTEPTVIKFVDLLQFTGQQVVESFPWQRFKKDWVFNTTGATLYPLPTDFDRFESDTEWNRSTRLPLNGPLENQQWQHLVARGFGMATFQIQYRFENDQIEFFQPPAAGQTIVISYFTRAWVRNSTGTVFRDNVQSDDDVVLLNPLLLISGLVLKWKGDRGMDTSVAQAEFDSLSTTATSKDAPAGKFILGATPVQPLLTLNNVPITGIGL